MNRKKNSASPFLIGLFIITGLIIVLGLIFWLGVGQILKEQTYYVTYFDSSVEGLDKGSAVKYQGVPCGRIVSISVAPDSMLVEVVFQIDKQIKIDTALRVQTSMAGIAGGKFLQLHYPTNFEMAYKYPKLEFSPPYTLIRSAPSGIEEMTIAAQQVMNNLMQLNVYELNKKTLDFLSSSTDFFKKKELTMILEDLAKSSEHLRQLLERADNSSAITDIDEAALSLKKATIRVEDAVEEINAQIEGLQLPAYMEKFYAKYDSSMSHTNRVIGNLGFRAESSILSVQELTDELVRTNKLLQNTLRSLTDNPSSMFFSSPPPPEK